jgi:hypothetical protein
VAKIISSMPISSAICLIWSLPETLVCGLLLLWVDIHVVARLDSALCNKVQREKFLSLFREASFIIRNDLKLHLDPPPYANVNFYTAWVLKRQISVAKVWVTSCFVNSTAARRTYLQNHGKSVLQVLSRIPIYTDGSTLEDAFRDLCDHCPLVLDVECPSNQSVQLYVAHRWGQMTHLSIAAGGNEEGFLAIAESCHSLIGLTITDHPPFWPVLEKFFERCSRKLQAITLTREFDSEVCKTIALRCPLLRHLNINDDVLDDAALIALGAGCPNLNSLALDGGTATDVGIIAVARNGALTRFELADNPYVTDQGLCTLAQCCPHLEMFHLSYCSVSTDAMVAALGRHCHKLRKLTVEYRRATVHSIEAWQAIAAGCPLLEVLGVANCSTVASCLASIARSCPRLKQLSTQPAEMPVEAVLAIAECCPLMEIVSPRCEQVGDEEITALALGCPNLKKLSICGTSVTVAGLRAIRENCKKLEAIWLEKDKFPAEEFNELFFPPRVKVHGARENGCG